MFEPAKHARLRNTGDPFELRLDLVLGKASQLGDIQIRGKNLMDFRVLASQNSQPKQPQPDTVSLADLLDRLGQLRVTALELDKLFVAGSTGAEDEPGDRAVVGVGRRDDRLIGFLGILANLLQAAVDLQQRLVHIGPDQELQDDPRSRIRALRTHLLEPFNALELFLLLESDLALDLLRTRTRPTCLDGDRRSLHLRSQLHRHPFERHDAEQ